MKRISFPLVAWLLMALLAVPVIAHAQSRRDERRESEVIASWGRELAQGQGRENRRPRDAFRLGTDYTLPADGLVGDAVVVGGNASVDGEVRGDLVVIFGQPRVAGTAVVTGNLVVVGGNASVASGASVRGDVIVIGGALEAPPDFSAGGGQVILDPNALGGWIGGAFAWVTRGLLWGRLIIPSQPWIWAIVASFFLLYLLLSVLFARPVGAAVEMLKEKPLTALLLGVLVLLLVGPVCLLLAVSVVGIAVIPFVVFGVIVAAIVGKIAAARWLGLTVVPESASDGPGRAVRSFAIGFLILTIAYMIPAIGLAAWTMTSIFGLGATSLAFFAGYRKENPLPVRPPAAPHVFTPGLPVAEGATMRPMEAEAGILEPPGAHTQTAPAGDVALYPRAMFLERLASGILDLILVIFVWQFLEPITRNSANWLFLLLLMYFVGFWSWKSATVGGIICRLRVVRVDGSPMRFADALVRGLAGVFSVAVIGLGFLWVLKDAERQSWHDRVAGTYVVKVPRNYPL